MRTSESTSSSAVLESGLWSWPLADLRAQSERLRAILSELDDQVAVNTRLLRQIDEMAGLSPQLSIDAMHEELRGRRLQEIAVELLRREKGHGVAVHYREWFELLLDAGLRVGGKEPPSVVPHPDLTRAGRRIGQAAIGPLPAASSLIGTKVGPLDASRGCGDRVFLVD